MLTLTTPRIRDSKKRLIPTVMGRALSDQEYRERERSVHRDEDKVLVAMLANENASIADLSTAVTGVAGHKSTVWRILQKLDKAKLVKKIRDKYELTKEGVKAAKALERHNDAQ